MAKGPIDIVRPEEEQNREEGSYHKIHKFSPRKKALTDFERPYEDEDGNWTTEENWMYEESEAKRKHAEAIAKKYD